ncbi:hypothetical protein HDU77_000602 [Chytriomyces hyalinus]|nr:hypothetical protein HDU77_000602 [Chytriomyces hyalinus]
MLAPLRYRGLLRIPLRSLTGQTSSHHPAHTPAVPITTHTFDRNSPLESLQFLTRPAAKIPIRSPAVVPTPNNRDVRFLKLNFIQALNENDSSKAWKLYLELKQAAPDSVRHFLTVHVLRFVQLLARALPMDEFPRKAVEDVVEYCEASSSDVLVKRWLYVLVYREKLAMDHVWDAIDKREAKVNQQRKLKPTIPVVPYLGAESLQFLLEAYLRQNHNVFSKKDMDLVLPSRLFDYITRKNLPLSPALCQRFMSEYAAFHDGKRARGLWGYMKASNTNLNHKTAEYLIAAVARHQSSNFNNKDVMDLVSDVTNNGVVLSTRMFNSIIRWTKLRGGNLWTIDDFWFRNMLRNNCKPNFTTLTVLVQIASVSCQKVPTSMQAAFLVDSRLSAMIAATFKAVETGDIPAYPPPTFDQMPLSAIMQQFAATVCKNFSSIDRIAPVVILTEYYVRNKNLSSAVALFDEIKSKGVHPTSRLYGQLLKGALIAGNDESIQYLSSSASADGIVPDKHLYHELIKADLKIGNVGNAFQLVDEMLQGDYLGVSSRSARHVLDDIMMADLIADLGESGLYDVIFHLFNRIKSREGGYHLGPLAASKLLSYSAPITSSDRHFASPAVFSPSESVNASNSPNPSNRLTSKSQSTTFYPPMSPLEIIAYYTAQQGVQFDDAICSAAIGAVIRSKLPMSTMLDLFRRFEMSGMAITPQMLCYAAEAYSECRDVEGVQWVVKVLTELQPEFKEWNMDGEVERDLWKRVWMASLVANVKSGFLEGVVNAIHEVCKLSAGPGSSGTEPINFDILSAVDRDRILKGINGLLIMKARAHDVPGVVALIKIITGQGVRPSVSALKMICWKNLEDEVNAAMGDNWL